MRPRLLVALLALSALAGLAGTAQADYRHGNTWMDTTTHAQKVVLENQRFRGYETNYVWLRPTYVKCTGDRSGDYPINRGRGMYHHMRCGAVLADGSVVAFFDYWPTGRPELAYRTSDLEFRRVPR
jgi:hypothetical protein